MEEGRYISVKYVGATVIILTRKCKLDQPLRLGASDLKRIPWYIKPKKMGKREGGGRGEARVARERGERAGRKKT